MRVNLVVMKITVVLVGAVLVCGASSHAAVRAQLFGTRMTRMDG